jgi:thioredoxin 1
MVVSTLSKVIIIGLLAVAVAAVMLAKSGRLRSSDRQEQVAAQSTTSAQEVRLPRLLDLGSDKCIPCKMMAPTLAELSHTYKGSFDVDVVDVRVDRAAVTRHAIRVIPTQIFYDASGRERFRHEGFMSREAILAKWAELGVKVVARKSGDRSDG